MNIQFKTVKDYLTKSNLPASDYVINPYIGCPHACKYCYACFMKRFTGHTEKWGDFLDVKLCDKPIDLTKISGKSVFLSSVTDCYNPYEETYQITRKILTQLIPSDAQITISTKSSLILRDLSILKQIRNLKVAVSVNTLDEAFKNVCDHASSIHDRLYTLQKLHEANIHTVLFLSPIFPYLTDCKEIINQTSSYVDEYWFENLNLRGGYKQWVLSYILEQAPQLSAQYQAIYLHHDMTYWKELSSELAVYCDDKKVKYTNYFYHAILVREKKLKQQVQQLD